MGATPVYSDLCPILCCLKSFYDSGTVFCCCKPFPAVDWAHRIGPKDVYKSDRNKCSKNKLFFAILIMSKQPFHPWSSIQNGTYRIYTQPIPRWKPSNFGTKKPVRFPLLCMLLLHANCCAPQDFCPTGCPTCCWLRGWDWIIFQYYNQTRCPFTPILAASHPIVCSARIRL